MKKTYLSAPLPFVGQKRMFARKFMKVLEQYPESTVFVDLFGGSGLLSHITKRCKPEATVIYNDFDNYHKRLENIPRTNRLIADLRAMVGNSVPRHKTITGELRERIFSRILQEEHETGYVGFITLSSSLMFSMKYKLNVPEMRKEALYNNIRKADPPYLSTDVGTYNMSWRMSDYLDVLNVLSGHPFVYFTSNKSSILELCEWIGKNKNIGNPFEGCTRMEFNAHINYSSSYTDMMLFKKEAV